MGLLDTIDIETLLDAIRRQEISTDAADPLAPMKDVNTVVSDKGAVGEMQIIPSMAMDPGYGIPTIFEVAAGLGFDVKDRSEAAARSLARDPAVAREYARNYLTRAYDELGSVDAAVGSYNMGIPGMKSVLANERAMPIETRNYIPMVRHWYSETQPRYDFKVIPRPPGRPTPNAPSFSPRPQARPMGLLD